MIGGQINNYFEQKKSTVKLLQKLVTCLAVYSNYVRKRVFLLFMNDGVGQEKGVKNRQKIIHNDFRRPPLNWAYKSGRRVGHV